MFKVTSTMIRQYDPCYQINAYEELFGAEEVEVTPENIYKVMYHNLPMDWFLCKTLGDLSPSLQREYHAIARSLPKIEAKFRTRYSRKINPLKKEIAGIDNNVLDAKREIENNLNVLYQNDTDEANRIYKSVQNNSDLTEAEKREAYIQYKLAMERSRIARNFAYGDAVAQINEAHENNQHYKDLQNKIRQLEAERKQAIKDELKAVAVTALTPWCNDLSIRLEEKFKP